MESNTIKAFGKLAGLTAVLLACACGEKPSSTAAAEPSQAAQPAGAVASNPDRDVFFGQTHTHTSWSVDAYLIGNHITTPEDAYKYSMGLPIKHPAGFEVQLKGRPLDFQGVTDHSEYTGVIALANDPTSDLSKQPIAKRLKADTPEQFNAVFQWVAGSLAKRQPITELLDPAVAGSIWKKNNDIADQYYKPGKFTTFAAYEWTAAPDFQNMHRNIFFRDSKRVPALPYTAIDSVNPEDLWTWMDAQRKAGNELLAISHNANLSNGIMFPLDVDSKGRPIDAAWAQQRINNEPLTEIQQIKGASETHPGLSPNDEFANFEIMNFLIGVPDSKSKLNGSYIREAYENGLAMEVKRGYNPYKMGVVGASDSHNTAVAYSQADNFGSHGMTDQGPKERLAGKVESGMEILKTGLSALGGVWAESNTRESIFDAMKRKEVFGTSGVRITVRLFGGWGFQESVLGDKDWVKAGYKNGVPMGADLPVKAGDAPSFIVWATKDPEDGNLDRIQIVKGWTKNGQIFEKVFDVAWSGDRKPDPKTGKVPSVGDTVDIKTATYTNTIGSVELKKVWKDPEFDPSLHAFYYVRVLQIPTPRWSTYDAVKLGVAPPSRVPATEQQRAWTSPIWYTPAKAVAQNGDRGTTVAILNQKGATRLGDAQLKDLVVGKTLAVRNTVTGERFEMVFGKDGRRTIQRVDRKPQALDQLGESLQAAETGPAEYEIANGLMSTVIGGLPFDLVVFKSAGKYMGGAISRVWLRQLRSQRRDGAGRGGRIAEAAGGHDQALRLPMEHAGNVDAAMAGNPGRVVPAVIDAPWVRKWASEPLVHFLLISVALFVVYGVVAPRSLQTSSNRIELTSDDLNQLTMSWAAQWQRAPTASEMRGLIDERVRQEILVREGMALGLDQGDEIIKRRIAQKMEFISEDVSTVAVPAVADLRSWFQKNSARFALPGLVTFRHLYFSPDLRHAKAQSDAARAVQQLSGAASASAVTADRFMFQDYYADTSVEQVAKVFGSPFAEAIFKLKTGAWQGPIESGLGWHLVRMEAVTPGRVPAFDEVDSSRLKAEWLADQRTESKRQTFEAMKRRYQIVLPK